MDAQSIQRTRSPHVKLQEFLDCFLDSNHRKELEDFSTPQLRKRIREDVPEEALRYFALVLLYGIDVQAKDISIVRKAPDHALCRMTGEKFYDVPAPAEEVVATLFEEIEDMTGIDETKRRGKLVIGVKNEEIDLDVFSGVTDSGEEKITIQLPSLA
ncbi:hypothetical protein HZA56_11375 [Candidatus Poribacteria bacterium]|nr:hypothetical protein [Candidatus Poribacteria bacterium]